MKKQLIMLHIVGPAHGKKEVALWPLFKLQMIHSRQKVEKNKFAWRHFSLLSVSEKERNTHTKETLSAHSQKSSGPF